MPLSTSKSQMVKQIDQESGHPDVLYHATDSNAIELLESRGTK